MDMKYIGSVVLLFAFLASCQEEQKETIETSDYQSELVLARHQVDSLQLIAKEYERLLQAVMHNKHGDRAHADSLWNILEHNGDERMTILINNLQEHKELKGLADLPPEKEIVIVQAETPKAPVKPIVEEEPKEILDPIPPQRLDEKNTVSSLTFVSTKNVLIEYEGEIRNDKANGQGVGKFESGSIYEGNWKDNMRHGRGTFTWEDGASYTGEFVKDVREGQGTYHFTNGDVYVGKWENDRRHGPGVYKNKQGKILYEGEWKNDEFVK
ncbi:MAG: hypothetical protein Q4F57_00755 [Weeksellaceae bacterium]|nr:hypothetical protein [Weeksellaceae bacterium]